MSRDTGLQKKYKKQLGTCREYAVLNLAFSVFDLFEDNENAFHMDEIRSLLTLLTDDESNNEEVLQKCADLRKSITEFTNRLVIYRERFRIYSDVLDRMTVKTGESAKTVSYDLDQEAALADQIVFSLARYQDTARRNFELLKCMNLLPIRMTKERFFDEIKAAAAYYLDGKKVDFDEYIEKIRMSGLLCQNDSGRNEWKRYEDEWERFLRFSEELNNNSETAGSLWKEADSYLNELEESIDLQSMLQDITNLTYTIAITRKYPGEPQKVYWDSMEIIRRVLDGTKNENEFIPLEGKIEKVFEEFRKNRRLCFRAA